MSANLYCCVNDINESVGMTPLYLCYNCCYFHNIFVITFSLFYNFHCKNEMASSKGSTVKCPWARHWGLSSVQCDCKAIATERSKNWKNISEHTVGPDWAHKGKIVLFYYNSVTLKLILTDFLPYMAFSYAAWLSGTKCFYSTSSFVISKLQKVQLQANNCLIL